MSIVKLIMCASGIGVLIVAADAQPAPEPYSGKAAQTVTKSEAAKTSPAPGAGYLSEAEDAMSDVKAQVRELLKRLDTHVNDVNKLTDNAARSEVFRRETLSVAEGLKALSQSLDDGGELAESIRRTKDFAEKRRQSLAEDKGIDAAARADMLRRLAGIISAADDLESQRPGLQRSVSEMSLRAVRAERSSSELERIRGAERAIEALQAVFRDVRTLLETLGTRFPVIPGS